MAFDSMQRYFWALFFRDIDRSHLQNVLRTIIFKAIQ